MEVWGLLSLESGEPLVDFRRGVMKPLRQVGCAERLGNLICLADKAPDFGN